MAESDQPVFPVWEEGEIMTYYIISTLVSWAIMLALGTTFSIKMKCRGYRHTAKWKGIERITKPMFVFGIFAIPVLRLALMLVMTFVLFASFDEYVALQLKDGKIEKVES